MNTRQKCCVALLLLCFVMGLSSSLPGANDRVTLWRTPNSGIQPQAIADGESGVHLIYFAGDPKAGDIFYVRQQPASETFSEPLRVNREPGSAIAIGTIRGAQLAVGRNGRVHVAWNGTKRVPQAKYKGVPMWYARLNDAGTAFEPQRDLITYAGGLDGGGSVAADEQSNVYVMWHGSAPENTAGEGGRAVFVRRSTDDGNTFGPEKRANPNDTGACGCCGMRASADVAGNLFVLYRAASAVVNRAEVLLLSRNRGESFEMVGSHPWTVASCPMSSAFLFPSGTTTIAAWETAGQVYFAKVTANASKLGAIGSPPGAGKRKHPVTAVNTKGELLMAWTEGTGWQKGGAVAWQLFDDAGIPKELKGRADGVPTWSLVSVVARPDGNFVIFY
jgi:hypothetical protein